MTSCVGKLNLLKMVESFPIFSQFLNYNPNIVKNNQPPFGSVTRRTFVENFSLGEFPMKKCFTLILISLISSVVAGGCATITNDPTVPVALSFSDGSSGECYIENKRFTDTVPIPSTTMVRRSDDALKFRCKTEDGREVSGSIPSRAGSKIVASAVFLDFGITDAITDKHREYPASFVIPVASN